MLHRLAVIAADVDRLYDDASALADAFDRAPAALTEAQAMLARAAAALAALDGAADPTPPSDRPGDTA